MRELKAIRSEEIYNIIEYENCFRTDDLYYPKAEVDAALNELRRKYELAIATIKEYKNDITNLNEKLYEAEHDIESLKRENEELKAKLESVQASAYAESVDAGMRERKLQRALYKACANWATCKACILECFCAKLHAKKWEGMFNKCRAKAEEYK